MQPDASHDPELTASPAHEDISLSADRMLPRSSDMLVVGIGASAGGLSALQTFFRHLPPDSGMAFVVILHLSPEHDSQLAAIIQSVTALPVLQVTEAVPLDRNCIYVIPPARHLTLIDGMIQITAPDEPAAARADRLVFPLARRNPRP
ncbi:hypothetical protein HC891_06785 [Candidatus Gracilibacteria bacterium]|nr:hypothetical protein [Candidatus Gracilibacteria bacterium]